MWMILWTNRPTDQVPNSESSDASNSAGSVMKESRLDHPKRVALERFGRGPRIRVQGNVDFGQLPIQQQPFLLILNFD